LQGIEEITMSSTDKTGFMTPKSLNVIAADKANREIERDLALRQKREEEAHNLYTAFMSRDIHPEVHARVNAALRTAAEQGKTELLVMQFSSDWCTDSGRAINNGDAKWPGTLDGFAKRAYEYWEENLKQHGFRLSARILNYPGGKPGDVGLFVSW
jgi:hypothetical protein